MKKRRPARTLSRRAIVLFAGSLVAVVALVVTGVVLANRGDEVATIDGHTVTRDELIFHMRRLEPTVRNELRDADDKTVLQRLETRALDEIWRDKTTLVLAKEQGLVDSVDYADFVADLSDENDSRAKAVAAGQTVYGVTNFSLEEYYTHQLTEITTSVKERLSEKAGDPLWVTDAEVRHAFDTDRDAWSANATTYTYTTLVVPGDVAGLQQRVTSAGRLTDVAASVPGATLTTDTYDGSGPTTLNAHTQDLMAVLGNLAPGQISAPVPGAGQVTYYQLDTKTVDEDAAFANYAKRIRQTLVDKKFTEYLQRRIDRSDIEVDTAAVDAINAEDVKL
ncbi:hypothetical protein [Actinophytocola sp.]|uniref:hypothetical protein n=1 Tax=Actinophytocola sp. TaxID=1872138 RepID=UPI002ED3F81C